MSSGFSTLIPEGSSSGVSGFLVFHNTITITMGSDQNSMTDVTAMFPPMSMLSIHYDDPISFQADTLELTFADIGDVIIKNKQIAKGKWITVKIDQWNRDYPGSHVQKDLGSFMIDQIKSRWPPTQVTLMASSVPIDQQIKLTLKNKTRTTSSLFQLAQTVATENGLGFKVMPGTKDYPIAQAQQWNESDLQMLSSKLREFGLAFKIKDKTLIVFDEQILEQAPPVYTIDFSVPGAGIWLEHGELTTQSQDIYSQSQLAYYDPNKDEIVVARSEVVPETPSGSKESHNNYYLENKNKDSSAVEGD